MIYLLHWVWTSLAEQDYLKESGSVRLCTDKGGVPENIKGGDSWAAAFIASVEECSNGECVTLTLYRRSSIIQKP
jgi:hypothetical protein